MKLIIRFTLIIATLIIAINYPWEFVYSQDQTIETLEKNRLKNIQFNFVIPSARAIGMGGAFIAIANDATAGEANPAGLTNLNYPEASIHYRINNFTHKEIDDISSAVTESNEFQDNTFNQSFLSLLIPGKNLIFEYKGDNYKSFKKFIYNLVYNPVTRIVLNKSTINIYKHELVNFKRSFYYEPFTIENSGSINYINGTIFNSNLKVTNWSFAIGSKIMPGFSIGCAIKYSVMNSRFREEIYSDINEPINEKGNIPQNLTLMTLADFSDRNLAFKNANWGMLWKYEFRLPSNHTISPSFGLTYKPGPEFNLSYDLFTPMRKIQNGQLINSISFRRINKLKIPDVFGIGMAAEIRFWNKKKNKKTEKLLLAIDALQIRYSQLIDQSYYQLKKTAFFINDVKEIHAGIQFKTKRIHQNYEFAIRFGYYKIPSHQIGLANKEFTALQYKFPPGKDEHHFTMGFGLIKYNIFQFASAYNFSDNTEEWLFSLMLYIGPQTGGIIK